VLVRDVGISGIALFSRLSVLLSRSGSVGHHEAARDAVDLAVLHFDSGLHFRHLGGNDACPCGCGCGQGGDLRTVGALGGQRDGTWSIIRFLAFSADPGASNQ
jgi:hypothetical protein